MNVAFVVLNTEAARQVEREPLGVGRSGVLCSGLLCRNRMEEMRGMRRY